MYLILAMVLALIYALLKPLGDGLFDTSMWVAKMWVPTYVKDNDIAKQLLKTGQASLMDGWLSNIPFFTAILMGCSIILGFIHSWWGGILMYFVLAFLGALTKLLWTRSVSYYLYLIYHKMVNRVADYKMKHDVDRLEAAESCCKDLEQIIVLYQGSRLRPPTPKQLKNISYGDLSYGLEREADNA